LSRIALILFSFLLVGCGEGVPPFELVEQDPKIVIDFGLFNSDTEIEVGDSFIDIEGNNLILRTFKFYISDVALIAADGSEVILTDVELVELDPFNTNYSSEFEFIIPKNDYEQIRFSVGLADDLNNTDPTTVQKSDPLGSLSNMYWGWADMFVFILAEATIDTNDDNSIDGIIGFHTGEDLQFRPERTYPMTYGIAAFEKDSLQIRIDWDALFSKGSDTAIDLSLIPYFHENVHSEEAVEMTRQFTDNFIHAISVSENK
jgi:hypothetical protein